MKTIYSASMDTFTKGMTAFVFLIIVGVVVTPSLMNLGHPITDASTNYVTIGVGIFILALLSIVYLFRVLRYEITDTELIIVRPYKSLHIPLNTITGIAKLEKTDLFPGTIRTFGNGGFFGYTGYFWNRTHGTMTFYMSRRDNLILIEAKSSKANKDNKIVISPDDITMENKLIELLKKINTAN